MHARTHAKKTGKDSRREDPACMFGFPTVLRAIPRYSAASRRRLPTDRRKPSQTSKIRDRRGRGRGGTGRGRGGPLSLPRVVYAYYHDACLAGVDMSSSAARAHKVEDSANTPTAASLSSRTDGRNKVRRCLAIGEANGNLVLRSAAAMLSRATKIVCT